MSFANAGNCGASNVDVRNLLMEMIWQGPIEGCADLARAAALDVIVRPPLPHHVQSGRFSAVAGTRPSGSSRAPC